MPGVFKRASGGVSEAERKHFDKDSRARPQDGVNITNEAANGCELGWYHEQALVPMEESFYI